VSLVYRDYKAYDIIGKQVKIISEDMCYGKNTVAEMDGLYYYMGPEHPGLTAAIFCWQELNNRELNNEELKRVLEDNQLSSRVP
jgi:hypothetical protein